MQTTISIISNLPARFLNSFAGVLLCILLSISPAHMLGNDFEHCQNLIKKGIEARDKKQFPEALKLFMEAKKLSQGKKWQTEYMFSLSNIGLVYCELFDYDESLKYYTEAYDAIRNSSLRQYEGAIINDIALLYLLQKDYASSKSYFEKARHIAEKNYAAERSADNAYVLGCVYTNLGQVCNELRQLGQAEEYFLQAFKYFEGNPLLSYKTKVFYLENQLLQGHYRFVIDQALDMLSDEKYLAQSGNESDLHRILGETYLHMGRYPQASRHCYLSLATKTSPENQLKAHELLAQIAVAENKLSEALRQKDIILTLKDSSEKAKSMQLFESSKIKIALTDYQHEMEIKQAQLDKQRIVLAETILLSLLLMTLIVMYAKNRNAKLRQQAAIALEKEKYEKIQVELEKEQLKNEADQKTRQLASKALYLSSKDQLLDDFIAKLVKHPRLKDNKTLQKELQLLKASLNTESEWDDFLHHFEETNPNLMSNLKTAHPNLTPNDFRFIAYLYMELSQKEIASILNITYDAVRKRKERLSERLGLKAEDNLFDYLHHFHERHEI